MEKRIAAPDAARIERSFAGVPLHLVNFGLAVLSFLILYWTVYIGTDVVVKHALFLMTVCILTAVVYPFSRNPGRSTLSLGMDSLVVVLAVVASIYAMYDYNDRFMRLGRDRKSVM